MNGTTMKILGDRETTSFFMSVGTGLMLETIFEPLTNRIDVSRDIIKIPINEYKIHFYNVETLIRNIIQSVKHPEARKYVLKDTNGPSAVVETLISELEVLKELYANSTCKPIVFIASYQSLYKNLIKMNNNQELSIPKLAMRNFVDTVIKIFKLSGYNNIDIQKIDYKLPVVSGKSLITTHITFDLLNVNKNRNLFLLESHTGKLKDRSLFYTKYHTMGKLDLTVFPFQELLLYIIGDGTIIKPLKFKVRSELHDIAIEKKWTTFTTLARIRSNIKDGLSDYIDISKLKMLY